MATPYTHPNSTYGSTVYPPSVGDTWRDVDREAAGKDRGIMRTPSPTPEEAEELSRTGIIDWRGMSRPGYWLRKEWIKYYIGLAFVGGFSAVLAIYHKQIVDYLKPHTEQLERMKFGYLIPVAILFVISFPPLFGHEIVAVLCGLVWGLWIGFAIVAAGTFVGEIGNFYAFKYCCAARGEKLEKTNIRYACLARVVREGGIWIPLVARFSAIPGHFTTAVFSTCGMNIFVFALSAALSLPKQFVTVYIGVILEQAAADEGKVPPRTRIQEYAVVGITTLVTIVAMWYILMRANRVKPAVIYDRRKRRQTKLGLGLPASDSSSSLTALDPSTYQGPLGDSPLEPRENPFLSAPQPRRTQEPSFDAYVGYGGRPPAMTYPSAPGKDSNSPTGPLPQHSVAPSPGQTPTQAQFAHFPPPRTDPTLTSPPLPTPTYGAPPGTPGAYAVSVPYQSFAPQPNGYTPGQQPISGYAMQPMGPGPGTLQHQPSFGSQYGAAALQYAASPHASPQLSYIVSPQLGYAASPQLGYASPPVGSTSPSPHSLSPAHTGAQTLSPTHTGAQHARDGTDATFYTAHGGDGSEHAPPLSAGSAYSNPYQGYMTPPAIEAHRTFSPPPGYHAS